MKKEPVEGASFNQPSDLATLRMAEAETGVSVSTLKQWIREGKDHRKLRTYYSPEVGMETTLVSLAQVKVMRDRPKKAASRGDGGIGFVLKKEHADAARKLGRMMTARMGFNVSASEAIRIAVAKALHWEESNASR